MYSARDKRNGAVAVAAARLYARSGMKRHCHHCGTILRMSMMKCPYCRQAAMSWLHIVVITAFGVTTMFCLLKFF